MREAVPTPTLVACVIETPENPDELMHVEYLQCEEPLTWTRKRVDAQVFADPGEAHAMAVHLRAPGFFSYTVPAQRASDVAKTVPARHRRRNEIREPQAGDWRAHVPNAGVL